MKLKIAPLKQTIPYRDSPLGQVIETYCKNILRVQALLHMPSQLIMWSMKTQFCSDVAFLHVHKRLPIPGESPSSYEAIQADAKKIWENLVKRENIESGYHQNAMVAGYKSAETLADTNEGMRDAVEAILTSSILATWTAFESLSGDLWEAALNWRPENTAPLRGAPNRIANFAKSGKRKTAQPNPTEQSILLELLSKRSGGTFDLSKKMGTALRDAVDFQRLSTIREAYSRAFCDAPRIDTALANNSLRHLSLVRNLIVHKAAIADETYLAHCKSISCLPKASEGQPISISGHTVARLCNPVILCSVRLIKAVYSHLK